MFVNIDINTNNQNRPMVPKDQFRVLLVYPNLPLMLVPPLVIGLFTHRLKQQGYIVDLFDTTHYMSDEISSPENRVKFLQARKFDHEDDLGVVILGDLLGDFRKKVLEFNPHIMIYSVVEDVFTRTLKMMESINDLCIPHIVGGVFPTAAPERCLEFNDINLIGLGEGENTVIDFAEAVRNNKSLHNISGTWYKDKEGHIHKNSHGSLINMDDSFPNFELIDETRFYRPMGGRIFKTIPIETYRGCPYSCTFCNSPMQVKFAKKSDQGFFLRRKSVDVLSKELSHMINTYSPEFFYFIDDSFMSRPQKELYGFCDMYEQFKLPFWFNTRPENCTLDNLKRLKDVGCYRISFGLECGNEEYRRKVLKRYVSNEKLIERFNVIDESGIPFSVNLIIGFPGETRDLIMDTIELVRMIRGYDTLTVSMFTPYHGTELRNIAVNNGWLDPKSITVHTTAQSMLDMPSPYVSKDDLDGLMRVMPLYCYFPKSEWDQIKIAEQDNKDGNRLLKYYSDIYSREFLRENQDDSKSIVQGGTGCKSNSKDSIRVKMSNISKSEISKLMS